MSPVSGKTDPKADVYVLDRFVGDRPIKPKPTTNAERPDTDFFYAEGLYDAYPARKLAYEKRRRREEQKIERVRVWARKALDALDTGAPLPPTRRVVLREVLVQMYGAGARGLCRKDLCGILGRDGGKISGVQSDLHAAGIIFPLEGVRR